MGGQGELPHSLSRVTQARGQGGQGEHPRQREQRVQTGVGVDELGPLLAEGGGGRGQTGSTGLGFLP